MFLENKFVNYSSELIIYSIPNYTTIMSKFINKYIDIYHDFNNIYSIYTEHAKNAIIYSKYYLYYKIYNCVYEDNVMNIIFNIEHHLSN